MIAFLEQTKITVNKNQYCICPGRHRAGIDWEGCEGPFYGGGSVVYFDKVWFIWLCVFVQIQRKNGTLKICTFSWINVCNFEMHQKNKTDEQIDR